MSKISTQTNRQPLQGNIRCMQTDQLAIKTLQKKMSADGGWDERWPFLLQLCLLGSWKGHKIHRCLSPNVILPGIRSGLVKFIRLERSSVCSKDMCQMHHEYAGMSES